MNDKTKKGVTIASAAATTIAAYFAYKAFTKQKGALEGLFDNLAKSMKKKRR